VTLELQQVIAAVHALPLRGKLGLLGVISRDLQKVYAFTGQTAALWSPRTIDEIAQSQAVPVISDVHALAVDFWPEDESADDLSQVIARQCRMLSARMTPATIVCNGETRGLDHVI